VVEGGGSDARSDIVLTNCIDDTQCSGREPYCHTAWGYCVACLGNGHCPTNARVCSSSHTCVQCTTSSDCGGTTPYCFPATNTCVACLSNNHCGDAASVCNDATHKCDCAVGRTLCTISGGRGGGDAATVTACYDTQTDRSHCGNCATVCDLNETCLAGDCVGAGGG
jgi:hypothetical protein